MLTDKEREKIKKLILDIRRTCKNGYYLANLFNDKILKLKDPELSLFFCSYIIGADVLAHGKVVIDSGSARDNYLFAKNIKGANILAHEKVVIDSGDVKYNYKFAYSIEGADVLAHGKAVIDSGDVEYNYEFAKNIKGADVLAHGKVVIDSGDAKYNYLFAKDIKGADILAHCKVVFGNGDEGYNAKCKYLTFLYTLLKESKVDGEVAQHFVDSMRLIDDSCFDSKEEKRATKQLLHYTKQLNDILNKKL